MCRRSATGIASGIHTTFAYDRAHDTWLWTINNIDKSGASSSFAHVTLTPKTDNAISSHT